MDTNYKVVEYINPCFPDKQMYRCTVGSDTYHTDDYAKIMQWVVDQIVHAGYHAECKRLNNLACEAFMNDVKYKD
jgi:isochorismate hydrolase